MHLHFTKMHGLGNDFVVIDATTIPFSLNREQIAQLGNRHTGIGFDQLLVITPGNDNYDFGYIIYNHDGSEAGNCGNGVRCLARYVTEKNLTTKKILRIHTKTVVMTVKIITTDHIAVNMGVPSFSPPSIPFLNQYATLVNEGKYRLHCSDTILDNHLLHIVNVGNPHVVIFSDTPEQIDLMKIGKYLQQHPAFPESVNVGLAHIINRHSINLRVYERGVGETKACGTGACAAAAAGIMSKLLDHSVEVYLTGGMLTIRWNQTSPLIMEGSANTIFDGVIVL